MAGVQVESVAKRRGQNPLIPEANVNLTTDQLPSVPTGSAQTHLTSVGYNTITILFGDSVYSIYLKRDLK